MNVKIVFGLLLLGFTHVHAIKSVSEQLPEDPPVKAQQHPELYPFSTFNTRESYGPSNLLEQQMEKRRFAMGNQNV